MLLFTESPHLPGPSPHDLVFMMEQVQQIIILNVLQYDYRNLVVKDA